MYKVKDLPLIDRPREKLKRYGVHKLSDVELLAILLRTGSKQRDVLALSQKVFNIHKENLPHVSIDDLSRVCGLGSAKSSVIIACFELGRRLLQHKPSVLIMSPEHVWQECRDIRGHKKEHFVIFFLNARNQEIKREVISIGTLTSSLVHPREVFEPAIAFHAASVVCAHNHPSDNVEPSQEDILITKRLIEAGKILGIEVLDHVIVTKNAWKSIKHEV